MSPITARPEDRLRRNGGTLISSLTRRQVRPESAMPISYHRFPRWQRGILCLRLPSLRQRTGRLKDDGPSNFAAQNRFLRRR